MNRITENDKNSLPDIIQEVNRNLNQQRLNSALQNYKQEFQVYKENCIYAIYDYLDRNQNTHGNELRNIHLMQAKNEFNLKYEIFGSPNLFSLTKKHQIFCLRNMNLTFNEFNYQEIFHQCGYYYPHIELIDRLYEVLSLCKETRSEWKYIYYKYQNHHNDCLAKCIFDHRELFSIIDGNILFNINVLANGGKVSIGNTDKTLLYKKTYKIPISYNNQYADLTNNMLFVRFKQPSVSQFKAIINNFRKSKVIIEEPIEKSEEQILLQLIIHHLQQNHHLAECVPIVPSQDPQVWITGMPKNILEARQRSLVKNKINVPINFIKYLLVLTNGDEKTLDQLAMLIARINLDRPSCISPKLTIIMTSDDNLIKKFFDQIYSTRQIKIQSIHDLCSKNSIIENIMFKLNGGILQICNHSQSVTMEDLKIFKKIVRCSPIHKPDKFVGKITYISNCHYIILAKKQEEAIAYNNNFHNLSDVIILNGENSLNQNSTLQNLEEFDYQWIHTIFATYGLLLLTEKNFSLSSLKQPLLNLKKVIASFLNECCTVQSTEDCYADELYCFFQSYLTKKYGVEAVKKITLINTLKSDGHYKYKRLRHYAKDYRWGFEGIGIKKQKLDEYTTLNKNPLLNQPDDRIAKIASFILKVNKKIRPLIGIE
jgi:hypothetical protein